MGKRLRKISLIIIIVLIIWGTMFVTDSLRTKNDVKPIFAIHVASYEDGGCEKFVGFFYNVYHIRTITDNNDNIVDYGYHITTWFSSLREVKNRVL
ncbi:MAG: hypothetical protein WC008_06630 [Bacilli bacterium]